MHEQVFSNQGALAVAGLTAYARALGLDTRRFEYCLETGAHTATVRSGIAAGQRAGVRG